MASLPREIISKLLCKAETWVVRESDCNNQVYEALESVMCDVIQIRLKRMIATKSWKGNLPPNIKTDVERPILKL